MGKVAKNKKKCYNPKQRGVYSMIDATNCIDDLLHDNEEIKKEQSILMDRLQLILLIKKCRDQIKYNKEIINYVLTSNKEIANGKVVVKGTRITPKTISDYYLRVMKETNGNYDETLKILAENYPSIDKKQLSICVMYTVSKISYFKALFSNNFM